MILLDVQDVRKHYGPEPVLDGVALEVRPGERIALVGPNGCGKTTLLKILAGAEEADAGHVGRHPSASIGLLEQQARFEGDETVWDVAMAALADLAEMSREAERVAAEMSQANESDRSRLAERFDRLQHELERRNGYHLDHRVERVLQGLGLDSDCWRRRAALLSGGQQNRLLLARLLLTEPDLMLLDEPSNHLDLEATAWLEDFLVQSRSAFLVVSHDRYFLDKVARRTLELCYGTVDSYVGNFSAYWRQKAERLEVQRRTYEKQQEEIAKAEDFIRRHHYGLKHAQAEDRRKKLDRIERVDPPREITTAPMGFPPASRTGDIVLRAEGLAKAFDRPLFENLTFQIQRGERWGVLGPNASGKTTLLRCVVGDVQPDAGAVRLGTGVKPGYLDQLTAGLDPEKQAVEAIRPRGKEFVEQQRRDTLARFGITGDAAFQPVASLSGGERNRTGLARLAAEDANFLVLDEPTNHLDLWARDALERALLNFAGSVLLVSHDRYFLNRVVDHLLVVEGGRFRIIEGNYDTYLHFVSRGLAGDRATSGKSESRDGAADKKRATGGENKPARPRRRFPYRKVAELEADIVQREEEIQRLQHSLSDPDLLRDGEWARATHGRIEELKRSLETLYEHWEEAVELN